MSLNLDKSRWTRVKFGEVVFNVNSTVRDAEAAGIDRVIAMDHLDPGELRIQRWGPVEDGTTFTRRVRPGQTLFGKRRAYQRKVAYAEFDAICSGDILTFQANEEHMLPEFLPFLVQSEGFFAHALGTSAGSLSPRTNWSDLSDFEFDLPPLDEQKRLAELMWAINKQIGANLDFINAIENSQDNFIEHILHKITDGDTVEIGEIATINHGFAFPSSGFSDNTAFPNLVTPGNFKIGGGFQNSSPKTFKDEFDTGLILNPGDLIVTMTDLSKKGDTLGYAAIIPEDGLIYLHNQRIGRVDIKKHDRVIPKYLYWHLTSKKYREQILKTATGSTVRHTSPSRIESYKIHLHNLEDQKKIVEKIELFSDSIMESGLDYKKSCDFRKSILNEIFEGGI